MRDSLTELPGPGKVEALSSSDLTASTRMGLAGALGAGALIALSNLLLGTAGATQSVAIATSLYAVAALASAYAMHRAYPHHRVGLCNLVTLARLVIVGVLLVATLEALPATTGLLALAIICLCLDGVDGWLARRQKLASAFGARFDVEVDAVFALMLALYAARSEAAGLYVLALGAPHYAFWIARTLLPWLNAPLPERFSRKAICVLQIATLIALLVPQFGGVPLEALVVTASAALIWSFGRDIRWLYRMRP
jgi:phosphatidylglycerophosphate synthase